MIIRKTNSARAGAKTTPSKTEQVRTVQTRITAPCDETNVLRKLAYAGVRTTAARAKTTSTKTEAELPRPTSQPAVDANDAAASAQKRKAEYAQKEAKRPPVGKGEKAVTDKPTQERLTELAEAIDVELEGIAEGVRTTAERAIRIGQYLNKAKELIGYGRFCKWCNKRFPKTKMSTRTRQRYQQLALMFEQEKANASSATHLDVLLEGGIEATLRRFQWRAEDLPPPPVTDRSGENTDEPPVTDRSGENTDVNPSTKDGSDDLAKSRGRSSHGTKQWVQGLYTRADKAVALAQLDGNWDFWRNEVDDAALEATRRAAKAWLHTYKEVKRLRQPVLQQAAE
jgi:hypothetical protein